MGDNSFCAVCFDLEQILNTPHSFESCLFYKGRLSTYNFTMYDLGSEKKIAFYGMRLLPNVELVK